MPIELGRKQPHQFDVRKLVYRYGVEVMLYLMFTIRRTQRAQ